MIGPWATRAPNWELSAYLASMWSGLKSPLIAANMAMSVSVMVFDNSAASPTFRSSMVRESTSSTSGFLTAPSGLAILLTGRAVS